MNPNQLLELLAIHTDRSIAQKSMIAQLNATIQQKDEEINRLKALVPAPQESPKS